MITFFSKISISYCSWALSPIMEAGATNKYTCFVIGHFNVLREVEQVISVVIPVYNAEKYLHECIESVLKQDYDNYEIVLVDDGSTDKSAKICDDYAARYERITVVHKKHAGLAKVRLTGVEVAKGQYIVSLDSDDVLFDGLLSHINKIIKKWEPEIICYDLQEFGIDDAKKKRKHICGRVIFWFIVRKYHKDISIQ